MGEVAAMLNVFHIGSTIISLTLLSHSRIVVFMIDFVAN